MHSSPLPAPPTPTRLPSTLASSQRPLTLPPWLGVAFLLVILMLLRIPSLSLPLDHDEGVYAYIGWRWLTAHELPYQAYFEMKPPLLHLIYGVISVIFGNTSSGVRIFALGYSSLVVFVFYVFTSRATNHKTAFWMTFLLTVLLAEYRIQTVLLNAEMLLLLPLIGWMWLAWEGARKKEVAAWHWIIMGVFGGLAILFKQVALYPIGIVSLWMLIKRKKRNDSIFMGLGILLPWLLFVLYFWQRDALGPFIAHLGTYATESARNGFALSRLCDAPTLSGVCLGKWISRFHPALGPLLVCAITGFLVNLRKRTPEWWVGVGTTLGMLIAIKSMGWKDWPHYYLLLIPGSIMGVHVLIERLQTAGWKHLNGIWGILIVLTLTFNLPLLLSNPKNALSHQFGSTAAQLFHDAPPVAEWIRTNVSPTESLIVWNDEAQIYYYSKRKSPSRYLYYYLFSLRPNGTELHDWYQEQLQHPPAWIVATPAQASWGMNALLNRFFLDTEAVYAPRIQIGSYILYHKEFL